MENSGRPYQPRQGGRERGSGADKTESWRIQDQGRGQNFRPEGGQQGKRNQGGPYKASPKKGALGPLSYSPGGYRTGSSPSQKDDLRWSSVPENSGGSREDGWRERPQQHWRRSTKEEGPMEDREQGWRESSDGSAYKPGENHFRYHPNPLSKNKQTLTCINYSIELFSKKLILHFLFQRTKMEK